MAENDQLRKEMEVLFGEETVRIAIAQEFLARRFALKNPIELRKTLYAFQTTTDIEQQKALAEGLDKDLQRAFICALLCDTATKALNEIAVDAIQDKRSGRAVLPNRLERTSPTAKSGLTHLAKQLKKKR